MSCPPLTFPPIHSTNITDTTHEFPDIKKFFESFEIADEGFKEFDRVPENKQNFVQNLESAYSALFEVYKKVPTFFNNRHSLSIISRFFFLLGRSDYASQMAKSRRYFQASLILKLSALSLVEKDDEIQKLFTFPTTDMLQNAIDQGKALGNLSLLAVMPILSSVQENSILDFKDKSEVFELSCILRWLGHACQNIDEYYKDKTADQKKRFELFYGLAHKCNQNVIDNSHDPLRKNANWEMAELLYNTERFMLDFEDLAKSQDPVDKQKLAVKKMNTLENVKPYLKNEGETLRAKTKLAQIENIQAIEKSKFIDKDLKPEECFKHSCEALKIAESTKDFDPFLLTMFRSNNVKFAMLAKKSNLSDYVSQMKLALEYAYNHPHDYNPIFYSVGIALFTAVGDIETANQIQQKSEALK